MNFFIINFWLSVVMDYPIHKLIGLKDLPKGVYIILRVFDPKLVCNKVLFFAADGYVW